jgi:hypothetical protein
VYQEIKCKAETKLLESAVYESLKKDETKTARVFRSVYNIFKEGRPYTDMAHDTELQELNGLDLGRVLHSRKSCTDIAHHVGNEMKKASGEKYCIKTKLNVSHDR